VGIVGETLTNCKDVHSLYLGSFSYKQSRYNVQGTSFVHSLERCTVYRVMIRGAILRTVTVMDVH
jgi:hypothetical protein